MIDHMTLTVRDIARSKEFYARALAPLGYRVLMEFDGACGIGDTKPYLWIKQGDPPTQPMHLAFVATRRADVDAFHAAALGLGARDEGAPGLRPHYHESYYAAFVIDPDGHPIEAVNHREPGEARRRAAPRRAASAKAKPKAAARTKAKAKRRPASRRARRR
jgi:catechol 2,3-dioxygenase-like lactoylglutathione lyase family enzyme